MNRRSFFKRTTAFIVGVCAAFVPKAISSKRSGTRPATEKEVSDLKKYLREHYIYWGSDSNNIESYFHLIDGKYQMISTDTSLNSVNYMIKIKCWDKDEPDIYTFKDGVPVT